MLSSETKKELLAIIEKLAEFEKKRIDIQKEEYSSQDRINAIRAKILLEIAGGKDNKGQAIYPTEQLREAALIIALERDSQYPNLREKLRGLERKLQELTIEHTKLSNRKALLMFEVGMVS